MRSGFTRKRRSKLAILSDGIRDWSLYSGLGSIVEGGGTGIVPAPSRSGRKRKPPRPDRMRRLNWRKVVRVYESRMVSAVRFHCETLSAIMRVDFMAAWLR